MKYIKYVIFAVIALVIDIACKFFLNYIVILFANKDGNLPKFLYWFQTFDATLDEGRNSRRVELANGYGDWWKDFIPYPKNWFETYYNRAMWLFRNTGYGFEYYPMGIKFKPEEWKLIRYEETADSLIFYAKSKNAFNFRYSGKYGTYKLGWKAFNVFNKTTKEFDGKFGNDGRIPVTISFNPFKRKK